MEDIQKYITNLRTDYGIHGLDEKEVATDPFVQLGQWMEEAAKAELPDPNAMVLSTVSSELQVSSRVVLLRGISDAGLTFYTNYLSQKGKDMEAHSKVSLNFFWPQIERQIRVVGDCQKVPAEVSDAYFNSRPKESQIGAWASAQSTELSSRSELEKVYDDLTAQYANEPIPRPPHWGGYCIEPKRFEFWQGRPSRLHDRIVYNREGTSDWKIGRLSP